MPYKDKDKQRKYQREWVARRRAEFFADKECEDCGSTENLELDHVDRETKVSHKIWSWTREKRDAEIDKCQVLCEDCHTDKTRLESITTTHGLTMYNRYGCRCDICREAKSIVNAKRVRIKTCTYSSSGRAPFL